MSTLTIIQVVLKNMERDKYAQVIHVELNKLSREFIKYRERWDKLSRSIDSVTKDIKDINITTEKITKRFDSINSVDIGLLDYKDDEE
jgi:DNA recombination protein RmuC